MIRQIGESAEIPGLIIWGQDPGCPKSPLPESFTDDWWYKKGQYDVKGGDFSSPQFPSIAPYMKGWNDEFLRVDIQQ